jgi:predicted nucleic-acid-binding protein
LESAYAASRAQIVQAIQSLLSDPHFSFEDRERLAHALGRYQESRGDLSDHLIGTRGQAAGARTTFTFDRGLRDDEQFTLL